jgi:hypothetical protein
MDMQITRLRPGEIIAAASAVLLLVFMFGLPWYSVKPGLPAAGSAHAVSTKLSGWQGLTDIRWLILVTIIAALALAYSQATRRSPAIPVSLSVIVTVLALLTTLALIYRVLINVPGSDSLVEARVGAYLALLSALGILYGGFTSMRQEGISPSDAPTEIETVNARGTGGT